MSISGLDYVVFHSLEWRMRFGFPILYFNHHYGNKQVEDTIEARARSLDINTAHHNYELLYSYHVSHSNYRKGTNNLLDY